MSRGPSWEGNVQYGNIRYFPRETPINKLVVGAMRWVLDDVARYAKELGVPIEHMLPTLDVTYVDAIDRLGHADPLQMRAMPDQPRIYPNHIVGWKCNLFFEGPIPDSPPILVEGNSPEPR